MIASSVVSLAIYTLSYINLCVAYLHFTVFSQECVFGVYGNDAYVISFAYNNTSNAESEIFNSILFFLIEFNKTSSWTRTIECIVQVQERV